MILLESARANGNKRFHHISTDEVFGALELASKEKFNENTPYDPHSPYSASKAGSDHLVRAYHDTYGLPITITNCANNYGPYHFPEKLIPLAITNILEGKKVPIYGDGLYVRDWLHVEDHCRAIDLVISKGKIGETYCVGSMTQDVSNKDIIRIICEKMNADFDATVEYVKDRPGHDRRYAIDWSKIRHELGWKPAHDFRSALELTVEWYRQHEDWWRRIKSGEYKEYYKKQYGNK
jgi:dTDP-glucose 4,6-dehydratase